MHSGRCFETNRTAESSGHSAPHEQYGDMWGSSSCVSSLFEYTATAGLSLYWHWMEFFSFCETSKGLSGLEHVTWAFTDTAASNKWVQFQFVVNCPFNGRLLIDLRSMHKHMHTCRGSGEASEIHGRHRFRLGFIRGPQRAQQNLISIHRTESLTPPTSCPHSPEKLLWRRCSPHQSLHPQVALSLNSLCDFSRLHFFGLLGMSQRRPWLYIPPSAGWPSVWEHPAVHDQPDFIKAERTVSSSNGRREKCPKLHTSALNTSYLSVRWGCVMLSVCSAGWKRMLSQQHKQYYISITKVL